MATTARDLITRALQGIGYLGTTESPGADDATLALRILQDLIDSWAAEALMIATTKRVTKALTATTASYTIGTGGDINIAWPQYLDDAKVMTSGSTVELDVDLLSTARWEQLYDKSLTSNLILYGYYDHVWASGLGRFYPWPIPTVSSLTLVLYVPTALVSPTTLDTTLSTPPSLARLLLYALEMDLCEPFSVPADTVARVSAKAQQAKAIYEKANFQPIELTGNPLMATGEERRMNIYTNRPRVV